MRILDAISNSGSKRLRFQEAVELLKGREGKKIGREGTITKLAIYLACQMI